MRYLSVLVNKVKDIKFVITIISLFVAYKMGKYIVDGQIEKVVLIMASFFGFFFFLKIISTKKTEDSLFSVLMILFILLPYSPIIFSEAKLYALWQAGSFFLFLFFYSRLPKNDRIYFLNRVKPILGPCLLFSGTYLVSYILTPSVGVVYLLTPLNILAAFSYTLLTCLCCRSIQHVKRFIWMFIIVAVSQLPIIILQYIGLTDNLPGSMQRLSASAWGGGFTEFSTTARYPGAFGDVELLAEFAGIGFLLSIGMYFYGGEKERKTYLIFIISSFITGFMTGTRAFMVGILFGTIVFIIYSIFQSNQKKVFIKHLVVICFSIFIVIMIIPNNILAGLLARFLSVEEYVGENYINRGLLFAYSRILINEMPFWGYGSQMMDIFQTAVFSKFQSPHSLYYSMTLISGYPGIIATVILIIVPLTLSFKIMSKTSTKEWREIGLILFSVFLYWTINEIKIEFIRQQFYVNLIFSFLGLISSVYVLSKNQQESENNSQ